MNIIKNRATSKALTSFDVAVTQHILAMQSEPMVLDGHSYGRSVISQAGTDSHVVSLVYVAAHMFDAGERVNRRMARNSLVI
jgi:hypothetical protein